MPMSDCFDCKCLSTSSAVIWPSVIVSVLMTAAALDAALFAAAFFCVCFRRFGGLEFLFCVELDALFFRLLERMFKWKLVNVNATKHQQCLFSFDPANLLTFEHFQCGCHHLRMIRCLLHFLTLNCLVFRIVVAGPAKMTGLVWLSISDVGSIEVHLGKIHSPNRFETNRISQSA